MRQISPFLLFILVLNSFAQRSDSVFTFGLRIEAPILDFPYMGYSAAMANRKVSGEPSSVNVNRQFADYVRGYESVSMAQAIALTKNLHTTNYYFQNKLWANWINPIENRFYNRLATNASAGLVDFALAYKLMVFGPVWMHEEFHRNGLTIQGISSFDETYFRLTGGGIPGGSVSDVMDQDMALFKKLEPEKFVRSFEAGIESQYQFVRQMQIDDFFSGTNYPNVIMNVLITKQAVDYVNAFRQPDYDSSIDTMNYYGSDPHERDFVGWDFTPWVYDMFRADEPYEDRGEHPYGPGVNRVIKRSQLSEAEDDYLVKMGKMQYLNFLSPFMIGIKTIKLGENVSGNFAIHHILTSFGYDMSADVFFNVRSMKFLTTFHNYHNRTKSLPGIELITPNKLSIGNRDIKMENRLMMWIQPEDASFYSNNGAFGGLIGSRIHWPVGQHWSTFTEIEAKTAGWVAGNPYLDANLTVRFGFTYNINYTTTF